MPSSILARSYSPLANTPAQGAICQRQIRAAFFFLHITQGDALWRPCVQKLQKRPRLDEVLGVFERNMQNLGDIGRRVRAQKGRVFV